MIYHTYIYHIKIEDRIQDRQICFDGDVVLKRSPLVRLLNLDLYLFTRLLAPKYKAQDHSNNHDNNNINNTTMYLLIIIITTS